MAVSMLVVFVIMAVLSVGILFASDFPMFFVFRDELATEVDRNHFAFYSLLRDRVDGLLQGTSAHVGAAVSALTTLPPFLHTMETVHSIIVESRFTIEYIQIGTPRRQYYALAFSPREPVESQWEASYHDPPAGTPCRYDFLTPGDLLPDIKNVSTLNIRCTYDPRVRPWYRELNSSSVIFGSTYPRPGRQKPEAYTPVGKRIEDEFGNLIAVFCASIHTGTFQKIVPDTMMSKNLVAYVMEVSTGNLFASTDPNFRPFDESLYSPTAANPVVAFATLRNATANPLFASFSSYIDRLQDKTPLLEPVVISQERSVLIFGDVIAPGTQFRVISVKENPSVPEFGDEAVKIFALCVCLAGLVGFLMIITGIQLRGATLAIVTLAAKMEEVTTFQEEELQAFNDRRRSITIIDDDENAAELDTVFAEIAQIQDRFLQMKTVLSVSAKYIPKEVITDFLVQGAVGLGMASTNVAMLFIDIEKFTSICERLSGDDLPILLEHYFDIQSRAILRNGGTIDKFIGDAIMCVWGAPSAVGHHNVRALATALRLKDQLELDHNVTRFASLGAHIAVRVGVHGGAVMAGNLGCDRRVAYTVVGHNVVVAGALEAMNKQFGTRISTTDAVLTAGDVPDNTFLTRVLGRVRVNGKPLVVHEVLGVHPHFDLASFSDERVEEAFDDTSSRRSMLTSKAHVTAAVGEADPSRQSSSHAAAARQRRRAAIATVRQVMSETLRSSYMCTELQVRQCVKYREAVQLYQKGAFVACEAAVREYLALVDPEVEHRAAAQLLALCDSHKISPPAMDEWTGELPVGAEK